MAVVARASLFALLLAAGCGRDVDLGGSIDAGGLTEVDACPCAVVEADGAARDPCGELEPPGVSSTCRACDPSSSSCQKNGCYGGYWCDVAAKDCHTALTACP